MAEANPIDPVAIVTGLTTAEVAPTDDELGSVEALGQLERVSRWLEARRHRLHVAIAGTHPVDFVSAGGSTRVKDVRLDELAVAMQWSPDWARRQIAVSRALVIELPRLLAALEQGRLSSYQAWAAADGLAELHAAIDANLDQAEIDATVDLYSELLEQQIDQAPGGLFRRAARRAVAELAPATSEERHRNAAANRNVKIAAARDGMATLQAYLTAIDAQRIWVAISAAAESCPALNGNRSQNTADALVGLVDGSLAADGTWTPPATEVQIVVPIDLLTGDSAAPASIVGSDSFVLPSVVLELLDESRVRRIVTDPATGQILDYGRSSYRPPNPLRDFIVTRDQACRFPGCKKPANELDLDHTEPWESGGSTSADNLVALCRRHHNLKTHLGWVYRLNPDGTVTWQSPGGYEWTDPLRRIGA